MIKIKLVALALALCTLSANATDRDAVDFKTHISGTTVNPDEAKGNILVVHQWQAHCGACPPSLQKFEKIARRKKTKPVTFVILHSHDKQQMARGKAKQLKLKLPVYHGKMLKKSKSWPNVRIYTVDGTLLYNGKQDKAFESALNKAIKNVK